MTGSYERVYTVWEYYDGPVKGVADYRGRPHFFETHWDEPREEYSRNYTLTSIDAVTLAWVMEQWNIWREWEIAFHELASLTVESHPGNAGSNPRYDELEQLIGANLFKGVRQPFLAHGEFVAVPDQPLHRPGVMRELSVVWNETNIRATREITSN